VTGRSVVITGGNAGLGFHCAKNVALQDVTAHVVLGCRSPERAEQAADRLRRETGNPNVLAVPLDLADLGSVRSFAGRLSDAAEIFGGDAPGGPVLSS